MKKYLVSFVLILAFLVGTVSAAGSTRASYYLSGYGISLSASGDGEMKIRYNVDGTGLMTKIGASLLYIEKKVNGYWKEHTFLSGATNPDFYAKDAYGKTGYAYFTGTPGVEYRVTLTAFAMNASGSDTGDATSVTVTCK